MLTLPLWPSSASLIVLSRKREGKHHCRTVVPNHSQLLPLNKAILLALMYRFLMPCIMLEIMLYFLIVVHRACQTLS